jgi:hypothetical protein
MELIKASETTKTIEITESIKVYRDTISRVEIVDIDKPIKHYPITDYTYDKIRLIGEFEYVYMVDDINYAIAHCNKNIHMAFRGRRFNAFELSLLLKDAVIDIHNTHIHSDDYMCDKLFSYIANVTFSEKATAMINTMTERYISNMLDY